MTRHNKDTRICKLFRCRCLLGILIVYCYVLVLTLSVGTTSAVETQETSSPESLLSNKSGENRQSVPQEIVHAAKRLIRASLSAKDFSVVLPRDTEEEETYGDDADMVTDDLIKILGLTFDGGEIESMVQDVRNELKSATLPNSSASTSTEAHGECSAPPSTTNDDPQTRMTGDRHAAALLDTVRDTDCLEREFDVQNEDVFDVADAIGVLKKCRILVLRNLFSKETTERAFPHYIQFISDVASGKISNKGTTNFGGDSFILMEDKSRLNFMATKDLLDNSTGLLDNEILIEILSDATLLGDDVIVNHVGTVNANPGGRAQYWHADGDYVPNDDVGSSGFLGVGGHDLPPFAINMFTPLLPREGMGPEHGPTEFCLGTSHLKGHDMEEDFPVDDPRLLKADNGIVEHLQEFEWHVDQFLEPPPDVACPGHLHRIPLLKEGDAVIFDYMLTHRGGANRSENTNRAMIFATYSKKWFRDTNFDSYFEPPETSLEDLTRLTRFALVKETGE